MTDTREPFRQAHPDADAQQAERVPYTVNLDRMELDAMRICFTLGCLDALSEGNLDAAKFIAHIAQKFGLVEPL